MTFSIAVQSTLQISAQAYPTPDRRRLNDAAQEFEGMLLQEMLKPMREQGLTQKGADDDSDEGGGGETLSSFAAEAMATAIARSGGLGIAKQIVAQVEAEQGFHKQIPGEQNPSEFQNKVVTVLKSDLNPPMN